jgi:hypothetical protein
MRALKLSFVGTLVRLLAPGAVPVDGMLWVEQRAAALVAELSRAGSCQTSYAWLSNWVSPGQCAVMRPIARPPPRSSPSLTSCPDDGVTPSQPAKRACG